MVNDIPSGNVMLNLNMPPSQDDFQKARRAVRGILAGGDGTTYASLSRNANLPFKQV